MRDNTRKKRIEESIQRELSRLLLNYPRHTLFSKITFTSVSVSPDLVMAKVFFSIFDGVSVVEATRVLHNEAWVLRKMLARTLNLRLTPRLNFIYDESIQRGKKLMDLIDSAIASDKSGQHGTE